MAPSKVNKAAGKSATNKHKCATCQKICGNKGALALHAKIHDKELSMSCDKNRKVSQAKDGRKLPRGADQPYMRKFVEERKKLEEKNVAKKEKLLNEMQEKSVPATAEKLATLEDDLEFSHKLVNHFNELLSD